MDISNRRDPDVLTVRPISVQSAASQIAEQLRGAIIDGTLRSGDRLPSEQQLARDFSVSRGTVREAIRTLAAGNLVVSTRGATGGTFIAVPDASDVAAQISDHLALWFRAGNISLAEVEHARHVLERECVQLAATNRTEQDLSAIRAPVEVSRSPKIDDDGWLETDIEFHTAVSRAAKNSILELAMTAVHLVRPRTNRLMLEALERGGIADQHWAIYEAIRDKDPVQAVAAFECHFDYLHQAQQQVLDDRDAHEVAVLDIPAGTSPDGAVSRDDKIAPSA